MKINFPLLALAIGAFGIGTTEFSPMGLLPVIAKGVDVSIPAAGGAVISGGLGYAFVPVMGAIIAGVALLLVLFSGRAQPEEAFANH